MGRNLVIGERCVYFAVGKPAPAEPDRRHPQLLGPLEIRHGVVSDVDAPFGVDGDEDVAKRLIRGYFDDPN